MVGKTAPESRVDLLDAVGDPDRRHRVRFQNLVDPGLAADAAMGWCRYLLGPRQQLRRFAGDRRKHVLHFVEQQGGLCAALEEHLRDLQRAVTVAAAQGVAVAVGILDFEQLQSGRLRHHFCELGLAGAGRAVQQDVDAGFLARYRVGQQRAQHLRVVLNKGKVGNGQRAFAGRPGENRHQLGLVAVFAHQYRRQFFAHLHQVGQVRNVVLGNQILDQADTLQPRTRAQGLAHVTGIDAGQFGYGGVSLGRIIDLELDQDAAQVALVPGQRAVQQQGALGLVELQQAGQRVDVLLHQGGLFFQRVGEPLARHGQQRNQVLGLVLGVFVQIKEQRAFFVRAAPHTVTGQELGIAQGFVAAPVFIGATAAQQKFAHAREYLSRPHQMAPGQRDHAVEVAPHIEIRAAPRRECQHKMRTHQVQHRGFLESR